MTDGGGDLWTPCYSTFASWLVKLNIKMKSSSKTAASSYPMDFDVKKHELSLRLALVLNREHGGNINENLAVNTDETGVAYAALSDRGLAGPGETPTNMAQGDKRQATVLASLTMSGILLEPFFIWNGKETSQRACVHQYNKTVQYQTENHYISVGALEAYLNAVLLPHWHKHKRGEEPLVWLIDCCSVYVSDDFMTKVHAIKGDPKYGWLRVLFIPTRCTGRLQPCDVDLFGRLKARIRYHRTVSLLRMCQMLRKQRKHLIDAKSIGAAESKATLVFATLHAFSDLSHGQQQMRNKKVWEKYGLSRATLSDPKLIAEAGAREEEIFGKALIVDDDPEKHGDREEEVDAHPQDMMLPE